MVWDREDGRTMVESYWILDVNHELSVNWPINCRFSFVLVAAEIRVEP
jgi:hypothetical protein